MLWVDVIGALLDHGFQSDNDVGGQDRGTAVVRISQVHYCRVDMTESIFWVDMTRGILWGGTSIGWL